MGKWTKFKSGLATGAKVASNAATIGSVAWKAFKLAKTVAAVVNSETKIYDYNAPLITNSVSSSVQCLSQIGQGTDYYQRIGLSVAPKSMYTRLRFYETSTNDGFVRVIIFRDFENRQAIPAVTDVLEIADVQSAMNHVNTTRFRVMYDKLIKIDQYHPIAALKLYHKFKTNNKGKHTHMKYTTSGTNAASLDEGNIFMLLLSDLNTTNAPTGAIVNRIRYVDN